MKVKTYLLVIGHLQSVIASGFMFWGFNLATLMINVGHGIV